MAYVHETVEQKINELVSRVAQLELDLIELRSLISSYLESPRMIQHSGDPLRNLEKFAPSEKIPGYASQRMSDLILYND